MKIALIGYGKMGHEVEQLAVRKGHTIAARVDPNLDAGVHWEISPDSLGPAEVCVEFTQPQVVLENIRKIAVLNKPIVVGTTGWYEHLKEVESIVLQAGIGLVYAPNFSLGISLFYQIAEKASELLSRFEDYDVCGMETHHSRKVDSPSGTAKRLGEIVLQKFPRKKRVVTESLNRSITDDEFHLVSLRVGHFPGTHVLTFDSAADTIELTHSARSRAGFALGVLLAAEWVVKQKGLYSFEQVLGEILKQ